MNKLISINLGGQGQPDQENHDADRKRTIEKLTKAVSAWYVRRDSKFYAVDRLSTKLSREDVERACITRFAETFPDDDRSADILKEVFSRAIVLKHSVKDQSVPPWNGAVRCDPSVPGRFIWEDGMVTINTWSKPTYRRLTDVKAEMGRAQELFDVMFPREAEKSMVLDWLAWCLQNEGDKPTWAPFLYSDAKGSGKSTLCQIIARLFGEDNTITQNNVDKLVARFNGPVLTSKLVISEELNLKPDSAQGNALKTFITEKEVTVERKGQEAEKSKQCCCFLFTTNHLPLWMEENERRYYLVDIDHDGHASGPKADDFSRLVGQLREDMEKEEFLAGVHAALMARAISEEFSAKTLNVAKCATALMKKVQGASEQTTITLMREYLDDKAQHAVPEADVAEIIVDRLNGNQNSAKHMMTKLGWTKVKVKWGKKDYTRALWVQEGYWVDRGKLLGTDGYSEDLALHVGGGDRDLSPFRLGEV